MQVRNHNEIQLIYLLEHLKLQRLTTPRVENAEELELSYSLKEHLNDATSFKKQFDSFYKKVETNSSVFT